MVSNNKGKAEGKENAERREQKSGRIKTLTLNRETIKSLTKDEQREVRGGVSGQILRTDTCTCEQG